MLKQLVDYLMEIISYIEQKRWMFAGSRLINVMVLLLFFFFRSTLKAFLAVV